MGVMPSSRKPPQGGQTVQVRLVKLHDGQRLVAESSARFRVVMCGRQSGKTTAGVRWVIEPALQGFATAWMAPTYKLAGEAWREILERVGPIVARQNEQDKRIELVTGGVIEVWTLDSPDPARGRRYKRIVVDEAGLVPNLTEIWNQALFATLARYEGDAIFLGTPKGRRSGFVGMFNKGMDPAEEDWAAFRFPTSQNPYIAPEFLELARKNMSPDEYRQEFEAIPTDDGANPFGLDAITKCLGDLSPEPPVVYGADLARAVDYTVLIGLDAWGKVCRVERWQAPWAVTKTKIAEIATHNGQLTPVIADATGVGDAIVSDLSLMGVLVTPYVFTQPSKTRLMQRLITAFQAGTITIPSGPAQQWLRTELESFEFEYTASGIRYEAPPGSHDDGVMALGLALHGWDRVQGAPPAAPAGLRLVPDDPYVAQEMDDPVGFGASRVSTGQFTQQLPGDSW